jgi:uncharacterized phage protein (TIGR02218 family)
MTTAILLCHYCKNQQSIPALRLCHQQDNQKEQKMKQITTALASHIAGEVTTLATCWKMTRKDGNVLGFTNHDTDIVVSEVLYKAASGWTPSAIKSTSTLSVDKLEIEGLLSATSITEGDLMAGKYDFAEIEIFMVNYNDISIGKLKLRRGWLGEVSIERGQFIAEVRGLTHLLSQTIGELYSPSCRASFGDNQCKIDAAVYTVSGAITSVSSNYIFADFTRAEAGGTYNCGKITFTSGANNGISMEIKEFMAGGKFTLMLAMPYNLAIGDNYSLTQGCDKTLAICANLYNNVINFRGEPHISGIDKMLETAGTRTG